MGCQAGDGLHIHKLRRQGQVAAYGHKASGPVQNAVQVGEGQISTFHFCQCVQCCFESNIDVTGQRSDHAAK